MAQLGAVSPATTHARPAGPLDVPLIRADFPILSQTTRSGHPLVYLDNAATSQKPKHVIEAVSRFYTSENANIHRGVYGLSERATAAFGAARGKVARFLGASSPSEIVFTRGTTEAINLVAQSWGRANLRPGDEVLVTGMEHHSNLVPWQLVCEQTGARLRAVPITDRGELDLDAFTGLVGERTRLLAVAHVSNALGTINPIRELTSRAHEHGALVLVDGAQSAPHLPVDVARLGCDFFAFSGHKLYGPTGVGVLYGRRAILEGMPPWQGGGDMIEQVTLERSTWAAPPARFEAGTPPIAEVVGLAAAIDYVESVGLDRIGAWESELLQMATARLTEVPGVRLVGTAAAKAAVLSFVLDGVHPHDLGTVLDDEGVAVRAGHHCAQPVMARYGLPATVRASFAFYNTPDEVEALARGVERAGKVFR
ncbi:MAG TPA: cysteine desulfurase [Gemmatimonadales bacterium]|nr:cysteine desulfurase [Gemmatimonadales bacterium]